MLIHTKSGESVSEKSLWTSRKHAHEGNTIPSSFTQSVRESEIRNFLFSSTYFQTRVAPRIRTTGNI